MRDALLFILASVLIATPLAYLFHGWDGVTSIAVVVAGFFAIVAIYAVFALPLWLMMALAAKYTDFDSEKAYVTYYKQKYGSEPSASKLFWSARGLKHPAIFRVYWMDEESGRHAFVLTAVVFALYALVWVCVLLLVTR